MKLYRVSGGRLALAWHGSLRVKEARVLLPAAVSDGPVELADKDAGYEESLKRARRPFHCK